MKIEIIKNKNDNVIIIDYDGKVEIVRVNNTVLNEIEAIITKLIKEKNDK